MKVSPTYGSKITSMPVLINGKVTPMIIDTGTEACIMTEESFKTPGVKINKTVMNINDASGSQRNVLLKMMDSGKLKWLLLRS